MSGRDQWEECVTSINHSSTTQAFIFKHVLKNHSVPPPLHLQYQTETDEEKKQPQIAMQQIACKHKTQL